VVPVDATVVNERGRTNSTEVTVSAVLEICDSVNHACVFKKRPTFMTTSLVEYLRTTLQNNVSLALSGKRLRRITV
jgi:hypothetical protein